MSTWRPRGRWSSSKRAAWSLKGDRVEAQDLVVSVGPLAGLGEGEEPQGAGSDAAGGGGLGAIMVVKRQQGTFASVTMGQIRASGSSAKADLPPWLGRQRRLLLLPAADIAARWHGAASCHNRTLAVQQKKLLDHLDACLFRR